MTIIGVLLELFDKACLKVSVDGKSTLDQMSSGNKALSGPKLSQTYVAILRP